MTPYHPRRRSVRLPGYDYTQPGAYFLTLVTQARACLFGKVAAAQVGLNGLGRLALYEWHKLPVRFPHLQVDTVVLMPNHLHGIIVITEPDPDRLTSKKIRPTLPPPGPEPASRERFSHPVPGSLATMVRAYKSRVTLFARTHLDNIEYPIWQRGYYEHVIRSESEWQQIRLYIETNPLNWSQDREYLDGNS